MIMRSSDPLEKQVKCECEDVVSFIPRKLYAAMVLRTPYVERKFIRFKDGAEMYSMSERQFYELARNANAVYKVGKMCLVKVAIIDEYLEYFREQ